MSESWHRKDCAFNRAMGTTQVECPHGHSVCPKCDPCHCENERHHQRRNNVWPHQQAAMMRLVGRIKDARHCTDRRKST